MSSRRSNPVRWSDKQKQVLGWWRSPALRQRYDAIICDGAVQLGQDHLHRALLSGVGALLPARGGHALCGKTIRSLRRNLAEPLFERMRQLGIHCRKRFRNTMPTSPGAAARCGSTSLADGTSPRRR